MADSKLSIEQTLKKLQGIVKGIDTAISEYEAAIEQYEEDNFFDGAAGSTVSEQKVNDAKLKMANRIAKIDELIMENPEIRDLIGQLDETEPNVKDVNDAIAAVLASVNKVKDLGIKDLKDKDGEEVSFETRTGTVVTELEKFKGKKALETEVEEDITKIDERIKKLKDQLPDVDKDAYEKYIEVKKDLVTKTGKTDITIDDVDDARDALVKSLKGKLTAYSKIANVPTIDTGKLKKVNSRTSLRGQSAKVKDMINFLKGIDSNKEIEYAGKKILVKNLKYDDLVSDKIMNVSEMSQLLNGICDAFETQKMAPQTKLDEIKQVVATDKLIQMFPAEKAKIESLLNADTVVVKDVEAALDSLLDVDKLVALDEYDANKVSRIQKEIARLENLKAKLKDEEEAKKDVKTEDQINSEIDAKLQGVKVEAKEIHPENVMILGKEFTFKMPESLKGNNSFISLEGDNLETFIEKNFAEMCKDEKTINAYAKEVCKKYYADLPYQIPFFSKFLAFFRSDGLTTRERFIQDKIKKEMTTEFTKIQQASKDAALIEKGEKQADIKREVKGQNDKAETKVADATTAKKNAFELDKQTRARVNAAAYNAAREALLKGESATNAEKAFDEAAKTEIDKDEGRE